MNDSGGQAFPIDTGQRVYFGLTIRDYFAAKALQGMIASAPVVDRLSVNLNLPKWAKRAYQFADAMMEERK